MNAAHTGLSSSFNLLCTKKHVGSLLFQDVMHYEQLKAGVIQHDLLIDNLIYKVSSSMLTLFVFMKPFCQGVSVGLKHVML